jgi:hypothetical protein
MFQSRKLSQLERSNQTNKFVTITIENDSVENLCSNIDWGVWWKVMTIRWDIVSCLGGLILNTIHKKKLFVVLGTESCFNENMYSV